MQNWIAIVHVTTPLTQPRLKIAKDVEINNQYFGQEIVLQAFPKLSELRSALQIVRAGIVSARGNLKDRDIIYEDIETTKFPGLVLLYREMQLVEPDMSGVLKTRRRFQFGEHMIAALAILVAIVDFVFHVADIHLTFRH